MALRYQPGCLITKTHGAKQQTQPAWVCALRVLGSVGKFTQGCTSARVFKLGFFLLDLFICAFKSMFENNKTFF